MALNNTVTGGELSIMKSTFPRNAVWRFRGPYFILQYRRAFIMDSSPFHGQTASLCILNRAPYGPICTTQFTGVASDLLEEKLRPFPWSPHWQEGGRQGCKRGWEWGDELGWHIKPEPHRLYIHLLTHSDIHAFAHSHLCMHRHRIWVPQQTPREMSWDRWARWRKRRRKRWRDGWRENQCTDRTVTGLNYQASTAHWKQFLRIVVIWID